MLNYKIANPKPSFLRTTTFNQFFFFVEYKIGLRMEFSINLSFNFIDCSRVISLATEILFNRIPIAIFWRCEIKLKWGSCSSIHKIEYFFRIFPQLQFQSQTFTTFGLPKTLSDYKYESVLSVCPFWMPITNLHNSIEEGGEFLSNFRFCETFTSVISIEKLLQERILLNVLHFISP